MEISLWGVVVPAFVFLISFVTTYLLYRHFAKDMK
jgi:hypothetical protein